MQWPAAIRHSGAWLGVQGVFNWSKYVVKFSAYWGHSALGIPPAPPVTTAITLGRNPGGIMLCLPIQKPKHDTWKWFYTWVWWRSEYSSAWEQRQEPRVFPSQARLWWPRSQRADLDILSHFSACAQTLASAIVSGPRSAHSSQGQHWDQLGVRRLMPFPTTFLLSPVVKCASKSKVNDNSQSLCLLKHKVYIFQIKIK